MALSAHQKMTHTNEWTLSSFLAAIAVLAAQQVSGQSVDPKIHSLCIDAKDYVGCVRAMTGRDTEQRIIIDQGGAVAIGFNSCPDGYRYKGNGYCGEVVCMDAGMWFVGKHNPMLAGKDSWCKSSGLGSSGRLDFTGDTVRASISPDCPDIEFEEGWQSTCSQTKGPIKKGEETPVNSRCTASICS